jgi:hypothetical protein
MEQLCNCRPRWEGHECTVFTAAEQALSDSVHGDNEVTVLYDRDVKDAVAAVRPPLLDAFAKGWAIAPASDGCGEPGLYHECREDNLTWLDGVGMGQIFAFMQRHQCGVEDGTIWDAALQSEESGHAE